MAERAMCDRRICILTRIICAKCKMYKKLSAHLVCLSTGEKIPLEIQSIKSQYAQKKFGLKIDNETKTNPFSKL